VLYKNENYLDSGNPMKAITLFLILLLSDFSAAAEYQPQDGDIIFHTSKSNQSLAIRLATNSPFSHVGIVAKINDQFQVIEAEKGVEVTPLKQWIERGVDKRFTVKRLKTQLTSEQITSLKGEILKKYIGKPYDKYFNWNHDQLYCSELVWVIFNESPINIQLSALRKLKTFNTEDPRVKAKLKERYGNKIPYDEKVVAPSDIFNSSLLTTAYSPQ